MTSPTARAEQGNPLGVDAMIPPVNPFLGLLPKKYWPLRKSFFEYTITFKTGSPNGAAQLAASASNQPGTTNIQADSDFLMMAISGLLIATDDTTSVANAPVMIQVFDTGSSQGLSDFPVRWDTLVGTAQNPFFLPFPRVFEKNGSITALLTNLIATARNAYLTFHGFKIYPQPPAD
jgi:hypothetical protein